MWCGFWGLEFSEPSPKARDTFRDLGLAQSQMEIEKWKNFYSRKSCNYLLHSRHTYILRHLVAIVATGDCFVYNHLLIAPALVVSIKRGYKLWEIQMIYLDGVTWAISPGQLLRF